MGWVGGGEEGREEYKSFSKKMYFVNSIFATDN